MADYIYDTFKLNNKNSLNSEDYRSLSLLYLPLMGIDSFALYSVLMSLEDGQVYNFKKLIDLLNFTNLKLIDKGLDKLQALGLMDSYYNDSKGHLFKLIPPLNFVDFFQNEMLVALLSTQIGENELNNLQTHNKKVVGYKNITKNFSDVYDTSSKTITNTLTDLVKPSITVDNKDFNYTLFKLLFDNIVVSEDVLDDENFKARIHRISYSYKLNEEEMKDVIIKTIDIDKNIEYSSIAKNARVAFQNKYKSEGPKIVTKAEDSFLPSSIDEKWAEIINRVDNMQFADTLQSVSGIKPAVSELKMFDDLQQATQFPNGVINLMILHVNGIQNGVLPGYNYFEKIANTWARAKVKTSYDVLKYFETQAQKKEKAATAPRTNKKRSKLPDWYDEYTKQLEGKKEVVSEIKELDQKELANLVKEIIG